MQPLPETPPYYTEPRSPLRMIVYLLAVLGFLATGALMVYQGRADQQGAVWWMLFGPFWLWASAPYALLSLLLRRAAHNPLQRSLVLAGTLATLAFAGVAYYDGFFLHPSPRNGTMFLFVPVPQAIIVGLTTVAIVVSRWFLRPPGDDAAG